MNQEGGGEEKNSVSPFFDARGKQILVILSALVERFGVSLMQDFYFANSKCKFSFYTLSFNWEDFTPYLEFTQQVSIKLITKIIYQYLS